MNMSNLKMLAIDLGASSGRGIIGSFDGKRLMLEENHRFANEPVMIGKEFHWDILRIYHEITEAIRKCVVAGEEIRSIGIDTWGVDYGLIGKNGELLANPFNYRDARTAGIQPYAFSKMSLEEVYRIAGIQSADFNTLFQLTAALRQDPEAFDRAEHLLFTPDLLNYFLTGIARTEYTIASTSQLLDAQKRTWSEEIIRRFGLRREMFGEIVAPGTVVGPLCDAVLAQTGKCDAKVVNICAHDTASAVVAVPAKEEDFVFISSGTWSLMGTELKEPQLGDESMRYNFTNEGGYGGTIRYLRNIMGLWLEQESRRQWKREGEDVSFNDLSDMAMASKPLQSLIDPDDPIFLAPGDMPGRIAEYCRKTGQHVPENKGEIVRTIFDSLALRYRWTVERLDRIRGRKTQAVHIVGGGTKEEPLCRLAADACGCIVYAGPTEATAIGNLAVQAIAAGEIRDVAEAREVIRNSFPIKSYEPQGDSAAWDEAYGRFEKLLNE